MSKSSHHRRHRKGGCGCQSSCPTRSSSDSCGSLSCLQECGKNQCMLVRQFLDFNDTGAVYLNRIVPVPCCQEVAGLEGSKNRLGLKYQEMRPPFFVEVEREREQSNASSAATQRRQSKSCSCSLCTSKTEKSSK